MTDEEHERYDAISKHINWMYDYGIISASKYWKLFQEINRIFNVPNNAYMNNCVLNSKPKQSILNWIREIISYDDRTEEFKKQQEKDADG